VTRARAYDILIIGAGPAGSAAARLLAELGHRVLLVDRPAGTRHPLAESIPPSARKTLSALGMLNAVDAAGFLPWHGNTVWWGDRAPRVESFLPGESGYQVERGRFDALLRDLAAQAGTDVLTGLVRDVTMPGPGRDPSASPSSSDARAAAIVEADGHTTRVEAAFILDASGRAGVVARKGLRQAESSHHTVALAGVWRATTPWPEAELTHTLVASHADGWAWSVPTEPGLRYVTVMVDPERTSLTRGASAADVYRTELDKVRPFAPFLASAQATLTEGPWGADASLYSAQRYAGPGFLLVGDAASFIDPLSSFGVKKALTSGWLAAIAVHTALRAPAMQHEALSFFDRREREVYASFRKQAAEFATDAVSGTGHPFWQARAAWPDAPDPDAAADPAALARDPDVLAALDELRRRPSIRLRTGDQARVESRPAIRGREIVMDDHLVLPAWPDGVRYLRNIDLILLSRLAPEHTDVGELYDAMFRQQPGVSLPDFLGALSTLLALGGLQHS
jgi:flavin-dependent dehydrogenase